MADHPAEQNFEHTNANTGVPADDRPPGTCPEPKPCCHRMDQDSRNLIVCIDGTSNQFGEKNTNVIEMYNLILKEVGHNQRTWYNSGIGTYAQPSWKSLKFYLKVLSHKIDLAIAWNFERTILAAYQWLSDNYEPGDCIFLFGFSRGAYQVRVLSAMIDKVGLIYKGNETQIPFAYELYSDPKSDIPTVTGVGSHTHEKMSMAERFKATFSYKDVTVHFVGAWDTVSSVGFARGNYILPRTIEGMTHVCYFRHALALDERRVKFLPEYAYGGAAKPPTKPQGDTATPEYLHGASTGSEEISTLDDDFSDSKLSISKETVDDPSQARMKLKGNPPHTMEVWFAGTHSDIGGGNVNNAGMDRSRPPLRWMVFEAGGLGLRTARFERELPPNEQIEIQESLTWVWWPLELFFFKRLTFTRREDGKQTTHKPHLGSSRKIHRGQKIHSSLMLTDKTRGEYTPKARPLDDDPNFWENARTTGLRDWLERDLYESTETLVKSLGTECPVNGTTLQTLRQTAISADGWQAVYEGVIRTLRHTNPPEIKHRLLHSAMDVLVGTSTQGSTWRSSEIFPLVSDLWKSDVKNYREVAQRFLVQFTNFCVFVMDGHTQGVHSAAFSPDGRCIVSGSADMTVRIWDAQTGKPVGSPCRGHSNSVRSVAFSPDGKRIVSGALDGTVRIWELGTGKAAGEPFRGHTDLVCSIAFSPDGGRVVSGSLDRTFRIWDAKTGKSMEEPFRGHQNPVRSVAFSPDGKDVLSGSSDTTVWICNAKMDNLVGDPSQGHTGWVQSIAFSPDGMRVVSGSLDKSVRIWDAKTGKPVGGPFRGHENSVLSVAFSPDGKHIVSGSVDKTVRIWDVRTGKLVGRPFQGHTDSVCSVAFSLDGKRIVSGSLDKTVRIWDAETAETVAGS